MSSASSSMTAGVIHPAHTLSRGKRALSRTTTSSPARRSCHAHDEPAGPPPTIKTSQASMTVQVEMGHGSTDWWAQPTLRAIQMRPCPRDLVVRLAGKHDLEKLQAAGQERGNRAGQIQPPGADEPFVEHRGDAVGRAIEPF